MPKATGSKTAQITLPSEREILIVRDFAAPKHLVYRTYTTPELVRRWWSAGLGEMTGTEIDLRVGGRWRYVMVAGGREVGFHGEYREVVPNERLVFTEVSEGLPGGEALNTVTFEEADGRTTLRARVLHASRAARDAHLHSGMDAGMRRALDLLEQTALSLA